MPTLPIQVVAGEIARAVDEESSPRDDSEWTEQQQATDPRERLHQDLVVPSHKGARGVQRDPR
jgi:hypothetical protein